MKECHLLHLIKYELMISLNNSEVCTEVYDDNFI